MEKTTSIPTDYFDFLRTSVPTFWEMKTALKRLQTVKSLDDFYAFILAEGHASSSQLFQDTFVDFMFLKSTNKYKIRFYFSIRF